MTPRVYVFGLVGVSKKICNYFFQVASLKDSQSWATYLLGIKRTEKLLRIYFYLVNKYYIKIYIYQSKV